MMKRILIIIFALISSYAKSQMYPQEWSKFTSSGYIYDMQSGVVGTDESISDVKNRLLDIARVNIAKQIQTSVSDNASLDNIVNNGRTITEYKSHTQFSTDLDLRCVSTEEFYNSQSKTCYVIAYVNNQKAQNHYIADYNLLMNRLTSSIRQAEDYISKGFKVQAKEVLESELDAVDIISNLLYWLNVFELPSTQLVELKQQEDTKVNVVKNMLADLKHGTKVYISCKADLFGTTYSPFYNAIKGKLSTANCNFSTTPYDADFVISIDCVASEGNLVSCGEMKSYFSNINAVISIDKYITHQNILVDEKSCKGGHTTGYREAAIQAYKDLIPQISEIILNTINE